jgi:vacuolar-type H+-ATPase subunit H
MQSSAIDAIRQAEMKADELLRSASEEAQRIRDEAVSAAARNDSAARQAADSIVEALLDQSRSKAEAERAAARDALKRELDALDASVAQRRAAAIGRVLRLIGSR